MIIPPELLSIFYRHKGNQSNWVKVRLKLVVQEERMKAKSVLLSIYLSFIMVSALLLPATALADGIIVPDPPVCEPQPCPPVFLPMDQLVIRYHHVSVTINEQIAVTHVDQIFYNPNDWTIEGTYIFPVPADAAISGFTLWVDGQRVEGQVLDANQARQTYEQIVSSMRDPALLEYVGRGAVQARIFPIAAHGERRIELEYSQVLAAEGGLVTYIYPLNTEKFSAQPLESVSINVDIQSSAPIRAVYSPSHEVGVSREADNHVVVGYEAANVLPDTDFALFYSIGETQAFHLLSYRDPTDTSDPDGFFLVLLAPRINTISRVIPKDIILVLDHSGSMEGEKFQQAQQAARYILDNLNSEDRFNIISFSTGIDMYANVLRSSSEAETAKAWVDSLSSGGSTDINRALLEAAAIVDPERPAYLIFLTDGLPTEGVTDSASILKNISSDAPQNLRLFTFGVGYDVDTVLLDSLSQDHHGRSTYVQPGMKLDEVLSTFYNGISTPVLTNLDLNISGISTYDLYPAPLPDLFAGSQVILLGRYRVGGLADISLAGEVGGEKQVFSYNDQAFEEQSPVDTTQAAIPRLWATRKVGYLLNEIRLHGANQEIIDQLVKLSIRYGIVTPYTSYLVTDQPALGAAEQSRLAGDTFNKMQAQPTAAASGQAAVQSAVDAGSMQAANSAPAPQGEASTTVKIIGSHTFVFTGGKWIDTTFDPDTIQTTKVEFLSKGYFDLINRYPELADAFTLGEQVIAFSDGVAYEVVPGQTTYQPGDATATPNISLGPVITPDSSTIQTQVPTQIPPAKSSGVCGLGLIPLLLVPIIVVIAKRPTRK
jgi:Ca-activated chloride channel homolog